MPRDHTAQRDATDQQEQTAARNKGEVKSGERKHTIVLTGLRGSCGAGNLAVAAAVVASATLRNLPCDRSLACIARP